MRRKSRAPARVLAVLAILVTVVAVLMIVSANEKPVTAPSGDSATTTVEQPDRDRKGRKRARYTVQSGDTLTAIAEKTGVSVSKLQELNPGLDPQILLSGQKIKLR